MTPESKTEAAITMRNAPSHAARSEAAAHLGETGAAKPRGRRKKVVHDTAPATDMHHEHEDMPEEHHDESEF
jgi:hypothetical protein